ncbi:unnamed protein product [Prunus armeniaca]
MHADLSLSLSLFTRRARGSSTAPQLQTSTEEGCVLLFIKLKFRLRKPFLVLFSNFCSMEVQAS